MRIRSSLTCLTAIVALGALGLAGCGSSNATSTGSAAGGSATATSCTAPGKVAFATTGGYAVAFAPMWAAQPFFNQVDAMCHTTISYSTYQSGNDSLTALLGGSVQGDIGTSSGQVLRAVAQGSQLTSVANLYDGVGVLLVARKSLEQSHGTDITKFAGDTWGYTSAGSATETLMQTVASHYGLSWDKVNGIALGGTAAQLPALQSGRADIVAMDPTLAAQAVSGGYGYVVLNSNAPDYNQVAGGITLGTALTFKTSFINQYPVLVQEITTAFIQGLLKIRGASADAVYSAMPGYFVSANPDKTLFSEQWQYAQPSFQQTDGSFPEAAVQYMEKTYLTGDQASAPGVGQTLVNKYVDQAYTDLKVSPPQTTN